MYSRYMAGIVILAAGVAIGRWLVPAGSVDKHPAAAVSDVVCVRHGVSEAVCTRCRPDLIPSFQASGDWCAEHSVPESQCTLCNPGLAAHDGVLTASGPADPHAGHDHAAADADHSTGLTAEPYPGLSIVYRSNQTECATNDALIQFATIETADRAGIGVQPVIAATAAEHFEAPAEVVLDQNATLVVSSTLPISLVRWLREPGERIRLGEVIATAESPDMAVLQGDYLEAWADGQVHERELGRASGLVARGLIDSATFERARADAVGARARRVQSESRLLLAGMGQADLESLRQTGEVSSRFSLRAGQDGVLLERTAPLGHVLDPGEPLARIGDPEAVWIEARVRERDAGRMRLGQRVEFSSDGYALRRIPCQVIWIAGFLDPHSRTTTVRMRPERNGHTLRAHEFGRLVFPEKPGEVTILVPRDAVQWEGCCNVVFVQEAPDRYRPRKVDLAPAYEGHYRVTRGLSPDDRVVVAGSFLLKTELMKGSIGAGCCGLEAAS